MVVSLGINFVSEGLTTLYIWFV